MKSRIAIIVILAFTGLLHAASGADVPQADLSFQGVIAVKPAEAGIGDTIIVHVRDLDGWVLDEIKQRRISSEGYFTDDQFETFLDREKAQTLGTQYHTMLDRESDAIDECNHLIDRLNGVIGMFQAGITILDKSTDSAPAASSADTAGQISENAETKSDLAKAEEYLRAHLGQTTGDTEGARQGLQAAQKELAAVQAKFAEKLSSWSDGDEALFHFKAAEDTSAAAAPGQTPQGSSSTVTASLSSSGTSSSTLIGSAADIENATEGLAAAEKEVDAVKSVFTQIESTWYAGWQAFQCFEALFRAVKENLYLVLDDSRLLRVKAQNPFNSGIDDATRTSVYSFGFQLVKDPADKTEWDKLYQGTKRHIPVTLSLAFVLGSNTYTLDTRIQPPSPAEDAPPQQTTSGFSQQFTFVTYQVGSMAIGLGLVVLALLVFFWFAHETEMLRDPSPGGQDCLTFSLARCQTAFWFFLFTTAFVLLWVVKDQADTLTDQCLVLLGISTGATIGTALITEPVQTQPYRKKLPPTSMKQFFNDLLSDASGQIAFYRFQTLIWTLVLGLVFIKSVYSGLRMPEFSTNELTLMGISAGTYVGFKIPEAKAAKDAAAAQGSTPPAVDAPPATPPDDEAKPDDKPS